MCPKMSFKKKLVLVLEMTVLKSFWWKHNQTPLGVNTNLQEDPSWLDY